MGIKNLHQFLRKLCPDAYSTISLRNFAYKKISIDISLFLYKYRAVMGGQWLTAFLNLIVSLRRNDVHCCFVYDGPSPPEKLKEKQKRKDSRKKIEVRVEELDNALNEYDRSGEILPILIDIMKRRKTSPKLKKLLRVAASKKSDKIEIDKPYLEQYLERLRKQVVRLGPNDIKISKELFDIMKIPYRTSVSEGESLCAQMVKKGFAAAALSEDTDLLACGANLFLHKINVYEDTCCLLNLSTILETLELTYQQFQDLCIMCGTDYNSNIPRIGPQKAYKLIKQYGTLDEFPETIDVSVLNYVRVRELFSTYNSDVPNFSFCGDPNWDDVGTFIFKHDCNISLESIKKPFQSEELVFKD